MVVNIASNQNLLGTEEKWRRVYVISRMWWCFLSKTLFFLGLYEHEIWWIIPQDRVRFLKLWFLNFEVPSVRISLILLENWFLFKVLKETKCWTRKITKSLKIHMNSFKWNVYNIIRINKRKSMRLSYITWITKTKTRKKRNHELWVVVGLELMDDQGYDKVACEWRWRRRCKVVMVEHDKVPLY